MSDVENIFLKAWKLRIDSEKPCCIKIRNELIQESEKLIKELEGKE